MHRTRLLIGLFLGLSVFGLAATYYPGGLGRFYGDSTLTNLATGAVYFNTASNTFWVGGSTSNPVLVGSAAWSNNVTASITNGLPDTNYVNSAVAGRTPTNYVHTLVMTNLPPVGTNLVLRTDDGTNGYWVAWP